MTESLPKRLLFLDIDGVLNSKGWLEKGHMKHFSKMETHFDPAACRLLNDTIRRTGCGLVLSSSWRIQHEVAWIQSTLRARGCPLARFYGQTPNMWGDDGHEDDLRGREISAWLAASAWSGAHVIVDDSDGMGFEQRKHLVRTTWERGMTVDTVDEIEAMFERWEEEQ